MARGSAIKEKVLEILSSKGKLDKEELVKKVAEDLGKDARIVKAVITRLIKRGELVEREGVLSKA